MTQGPDLVLMPFPVLIKHTIIHFHCPLFAFLIWLVNVIPLVKMTVAFGCVSTARGDLIGWVKSVKHGKHINMFINRISQWVSHWYYSSEWLHLLFYFCFSFLFLPWRWSFSIISKSFISLTPQQNPKIIIYNTSNIIAMYVNNFKLGADEYSSREDTQHIQERVRRCSAGDGVSMNVWKLDCLSRWETWTD